MNAAESARLLTIGEFSTATQLSAKALRLYDEARLLRPASVDAANGYRYYRRDQIVVARLIRTLREMDVPLAVIATIVASPREQAGALLLDCASEIDRRYARQKRAFQTGLAMLHRQTIDDAPSIASEARPRTLVAVHETTVTRATLLQQLHVEFGRIRSRFVASVGEPFCRLIEPLSDDESRIEVALPIAVSEASPRIATRLLPDALCAIHRSASVADTSCIEAALDAMFDWADRRAYRVTEPPCVALPVRDDRAAVEIVWAYEPTAASEQSS